MDTGVPVYIDGLGADCGISRASTMKTPQSYTSHQYDPVQVILVIIENWSLIQIDWN